MASESVGKEIFRQAGLALAEALRYSERSLEYLLLDFSQHLGNASNASGLQSCIPFVLLYKADLSRPVAQNCSGSELSWLESQFGPFRLVSSAHNRVNEYAVKFHVELPESFK